MTGFRVTTSPSFLPSVRAAEDRAVQAVADRLLAQALKRVPVEDGELKNSGRVTVRGRQARVSFDTAYAARQHEDLTARHDPGRGAKFLEGPADQMRREAARLVAQTLRDAL